MALTEPIAEAVDISSTALLSVIGEMGQVMLWLQAVGVILIAWLAIQVFILIKDKKKRKTLYQIQEDLEKIDKKIDKLLKKKK